jgi:4-hydroxythreonine-4-phosphate dehydrogenase
VTLPRIILTSGEPAGIGPDLCLAIADREWPCDLVVAADRKILEARAVKLGWRVALENFSTTERYIHRRGHLRVLHVPAKNPASPGKLDVANASYVLELLNVALKGVVDREFDAIVTAPLQKSVIMDAGVPFSGHTEYFAERCGVPRPVMMLVAKELRVALATTHLPLTQVSGAITRTSLTEVIEILERDLKRRFGLARPRILVCGLNPHAGEAGHLGREEIEVIAPAIDALRSRGLEVTGPVPADTAFTPRMLERADVVLAMFHDQGLPVLKYAGFGDAVNVTLGLPIIRTSVDHGTALDLAGTGKADAGSLAAALTLAIELSSHALTHSA